MIIAALITMLLKKGGRSCVQSRLLVSHLSHLISSVFLFTDQLFIIII